MSVFEKTLKDYIKDLESEDKSVRLRAINLIGQWRNDRGVDPLIKMLTDKNNDIRREAARALKEIGNKRAIPALLPLLHSDDSPEVRAEVSFCLGYFQEASEHVDVIIEALSDDHYLVRQNAAFALGKLGRKKSTTHLITALTKDTNYNVREIAAWSLGELRDKRATEFLIKALDDEKLEVRKNAAHALGRLEDKSAIAPLKAQLLRAGEIREPVWALSKLLTKKEHNKLLIDVFKRKKKEKLLEDCIQITKLLLDYDRKTAEFLINEIMKDATFKSYQKEIENLL